MHRYPIRDPFFKMIPRSLANFMNAYTSLDHTSYPFATTNRQDFRNLTSVYLDATLQPLLKKTDFHQEGWRIGPENPMATANEKDESSDKLSFKGVVYNEMKGQMSDATYLYYIKFFEQIFPDIQNSGGDPAQMTQLSHKNLVDFHRQHYHPSNSKILTYGHLPLGDYAQDLAEALMPFNRKPIVMDIKAPIDIGDTPKYKVLPGPTDPLVPQNRQYKTSTTWVACDTSDTEEMFALGILSTLLVSGYGCPAYQQLIETGLGTDFTPNTGLDGCGRKAIFSLGLSGVTKENVSNVKKYIFKMLRKTKEGGFSKTKIDGILQQLELSRKHKTADFGLGLISNIMSGWFSGVDPFDSLSWDKCVRVFKERTTKGPYVESLIEKYFLNDRTFTFTMEPVHDYEERLVFEESQRLQVKISEMAKQVSDGENIRDHLAAREMKLLHVQEKARSQDLKCLPSLHVGDIQREKPFKPIRESFVLGSKVQWREASTNGLTYFRAVNAFHGLPNELRKALPLFCGSIMRLGTKRETMEQLEEKIRLNTGGISVGYHASNSPYSIEKTEEGIFISAYAFDRHVPIMFDLIRTLVMETDFDSPAAEQMVRQLLQTSADGAINNIAESGTAFASTSAEAGLSTVGYLNEMTSGLSQVRFTTELASRPLKSSLKDIIGLLKKIQSFAISNFGTLRFAITCGSEVSGVNETSLRNFLEKIPQGTQGHISPLDIKLPRISKSFFPLPYQVYYSAFAVPTIPYVADASPSLQILAQLLTHKHLHHEIREKGGAYGSGAAARSLGGTFAMSSFRDPNPSNSLKIMHDAGSWARDKEWNDRDIEEAKITLFQRVDAPESINEEGMIKFTHGIDQEMAQSRRNRVLDVTSSNVREAADQYLVQRLERSANIALLGPPATWISQDQGWTSQEVGVAKADTVQ